MNQNDFLVVSDEIRAAIRESRPVVALETAVVTHGLPYPVNLEMAGSVEKIIRSSGAVPATIGVLAGRITVGMSSQDLSLLASGKDLAKISTRNLGIVVSQKLSGGTTVAGTMVAAELAGIKVFSTGGIGGVHRHNPLDVSADLPELSQNPLIVVCSGAKAILDLPGTLEVLETYGVPVIGYGTNELPSFYSSKSGLPVDLRLDNSKDIASLAAAQWILGLNNAILVCNPPPPQFELPVEKTEKVIQNAIREAEHLKISGAKITPFLLDQIRKNTDGESLKTNIALLENNARLAAEIAVAFSKIRRGGNRFSIV